MDREQSTGALSTEVLAQKGKKWVLFSSFKEAYRKRLRKNGELLFDLLFGLAACFFASTHAAFGVYPFSIGLLLAGTARPVPILIGGVIGCYFLGEVGTLYLVLHLLAFALRLLFSRPTQRRRLASSEAYFEEAPALRAVAGVVLGTLMALYELILFGVKSYTLLFAAGAVLLLPGVTLLFSFLTAQRPTLGLLLGRRTVSDDAAFSPAFGERSTFFLAVGGLFFLFVTSLSLAP